MGMACTKQGENVWFACRKRAAMYNDKLNSREGAAELIGVSPSSLADYELGITKVVPVDKAVIMSDVYNSPELLAYYSFTLTKSASFSYGNGTCVVFKKNGKVDSVLDTRYDHDVMKDFGAWCMSFLEAAFDRSYEPKITEITEA